MSNKRLALAAPVLLAALFAWTAGSAAPGPMGLAAAADGSAITKADYYYPGDYGYGEPPRDGRGLGDIPGAVIGGAVGAVTGAIGGAIHGSEYYARPYYGPAYYEYRGGYYGGGYYGGGYYGDGGYASGFEDSPAAACQRNFPTFDPETGTYITDDGEEVLCPYLDR